MELLVPFILKSCLIVGATLGLLFLLRGRSASERGMVAHFGLLALLILPLGSMILPQLVIEAPVLRPSEPAAAIVAGGSAAAAATSEAIAATSSGSTGIGLADLWPLAYGLPAAALLAITLLAVLRLLALRARASVMVEPSWLSALAHAQRRMDFKHGTALLSSPELKSPISWGVLRPVILLNDEAIEARHEAEAIIAHELAHVRGLDWAKLLLARVVTALFWFNPLVWMLAREAHQLREETADDAVLAANVGAADYAQLLVGVARHDCKGLLLASHGVAPGKNSLSRRVRRVLDAGLPRTPVARGFAAGIALGVIGTAAPLAAITLTPRAADVDTSKPYYVSAPAPAESLPSVVAQTVAEATAATGEAVGAKVAAALSGEDAVDASFEKALEKSLEKRIEKKLEMREAIAEHADAKARAHAMIAIERAAAWKGARVNPDYAAQIRAAAPRLKIEDEELIPMRAVGVTPEWLRGMMGAGYPVRDVGDLIGARAAGVTPAYVADLARAGYRGVPLDELAGLRAIGVSGEYIRSLRAAGVTGLSVDELVELRAKGIRARDARAHRARRILTPPGGWGNRPPPDFPDEDEDSESE